MAHLEKGLTLVTEIGQDSPTVSEAKIRAIENDCWPAVVPGPLYDLLRTALPMELQEGRRHDYAKIVDLFDYLSKWTSAHKRNDSIPSGEEYSIEVFGKGLNKRIGNDYAKYLKFLSRHKVIAWKEGRTGFRAAKTYGDNAASKRVRILKPYINSPVVVASHRPSKYTVKRKEKNLRIEFQTPFDEYRYGVLLKVEIDFPRVLATILSAQSKGVLSEAKAKAHLDAVTKIRTKQISYCVDKYGRQHSTILGLFKGYRDGLTIDGEALGSIDIKTSQLRLFVVVLKWAIDVAEGGPAPQVQGRYVLQVLDKLARSIAPEDLPGIRSDLAKLEGWIREDIYNVVPYWLMEDGHRTLKQFQKEGLHDREARKRLTMKLLYGSHNARKHLVRSFEKRLPALSKVLKAVKAGTTKKEKNLLCHALQNLESTIVLDDIGGQLERAGIDCIYLHDSVLCPNSRMDEATTIFRNTLLRYGLSDAIKVEKELPDHSEASYLRRAG